VPISRSAAAIEGLEEVWGSLVALGETLTDEQFEVRTDCPGWTVKDQFSHVIGTELLLEGAAAPDGDAPRAPHVRNDLGELNERFVEARRALAGRHVVAELGSLAAHRLVALRSLDAEAWAAIGPSPIGMVPYVDYMGVRTFDSWVHEQDVRVALGLPGGRGGAGERVTLDRMEASMPYVLGRRVQPRPGTTLRIDIDGALGRTVQLAVGLSDDGSAWARAIPVIEGAPTASLWIDEAVFVRRACGRIPASAVLASSGFAAAGDTTLAEQFVEHMVVMI
jgi:uncharacterized protein (TIGR03083 family)